MTEVRDVTTDKAAGAGHARAGFPPGLDRNRSALILDRIDRIEPRFKGSYEVILTDGTSLPLSRTYRNLLEDRAGESF